MQDTQNKPWQQTSQGYNIHKALETSTQAANLPLPTLICRLVYSFTKELKCKQKLNQLKTH